MSATASQWVTVAPIDQSVSTGAVLLATAAGQGLYPISGIYELGPEAFTFSPMLQLTFSYSTTTLAELNILEQDIFIYHYDADTGWTAVAGQVRDTARKEIRLEVSTLASIFALFGKAKDVTPPITSLTATGPRFEVDGILYGSSSTVFGLAAVDPVVRATSTGVDFSEYRLDAGTPDAAFTRYAGTLILPPGRHVLDFRSQDRAGNLESSSTVKVVVDASAPAIMVSSPVAGRTYSGSDAIQISFHIADDWDSNPSSSAFLVRIASVPLKVQVRDGDSLAPAELGSGMWTLEVAAADFVGNSTYAVTPFTVISDTLAPRTVLSIGQPSADFSSGAVYATQGTTFGLVAVDDLLRYGDGQGLGVMQTFLAIDSAPFAVYSSTFSLLSEGSHTIRFYSLDVIGNAEQIQQSLVTVDIRAPGSTLELSGSRYVDISTRTFISGFTKLGFQAEDPGGVLGSGVDRIEYRLDSAPDAAFSAFLSSFSLSEGVHRLDYRGVDRLGNLELANSATVYVDATPPVAWAEVQGDSRTIEGELQLEYSLSIAMRYQDMGTWASGAADIFYVVDVDSTSCDFGRIVSDMPTGTCSNPKRGSLEPSFTLPIGTHTISYFAMDNVGNKSAVSALRVRSMPRADREPPTTVMSFAGTTVTAFGLDVLSSSATVVLAAAETVSTWTVSGILSTSYSVDGGPAQTYLGPFRLAEGTHVVAYWSTDNALNEESHHSSTIAVAGFIDGPFEAYERLDGSGQAGVGGSVASNGAIALGGSARIYGNATAPAVSLGGRASITGTVSKTSAGLMPEPINLELASALARVSSSNSLIPANFLVGGDLIIESGKTLLLSTGAYVVRDLKISGQGKLSVNGPVSMLVERNVELSGGASLNAEGKALDFVLFMSSAGSISAYTSAAASAIVYAPRSTLSLSGTARFGGRAFSRAMALSGSVQLASTSGLLPASLTAGGYRVADAGSEVFALREIYVFPNPAVGGARPTVHASVGFADQVKIKIYDIAGSLVHEATLDGVPEVINGEYAYEHAWDGRIPSGVYYYVVRAEKAGYAPIKKAGKLAVVR